MVPEVLLLKDNNKDKDRILTNNKDNKDNKVNKGRFLKTY